MDESDHEPALDFEAVYRRNADAIYRFCLAQLREPAAAEDLAADVFAAAFAALPHAHPDASGIRPWLFRIARNAVVDRGRSLRRQRRVLRLFFADTNHAEVEHAAELRAELRGAIAAIGRLPRRQRLLVGLRVAAGLSFAEIGAVMGMKENAARMATTRALQRVRLEVER